MILLALWLGYVATFSRDYITRTAPLSYHGALEEQVLELTAARNFIKFGFFTNLLLPDYAVSPRAEDHPFLYSHMPSGPSVLLGVLLKAGWPMEEIRGLATFFSLAGIFFFALFIGRFFANPWLGLFSGMFMTMSYGNMFIWLDHFVHCYHFLSIFGCSYCFLGFVQTRSRISLAGTFLFLGLSLLSSFLSLVALTIMLTLTVWFFYRHDRRAWRLLAWCFAVSVAWIFVLVGRNMIALGPAVALKELFFTITNRIAGLPRREDLKQFFEAHNLALWGANNYRPGILAAWLKENLNLANRLFTIAGLILAYMYLFESKRLRHGLSVAGKVLIMVVANFSWYIIFSAHGQNYILGFIVWSFLAMCFLLTAGLINELLKDFAELPLSNIRGFKTWSKKNQCAFALCIWASITMADYFKIRAFDVWNNWEAESVQDFNAQVITDQFVYLKKYGPEEVIWTNTNAILLSYFTPARIVGTCSQSAFLKQDISGCMAILMKDWRSSLAQLSKPSLYMVSDIMVSSPDVFTLTPHQAKDVVDKIKEDFGTVERQTPWGVIMRVHEPKR